MAYRPAVWRSRNDNTANPPCANLVWSDLARILLGALGALPHDGCYCRIAAMFHQQCQVNEGFIVIRLQIHGSAKTVFGLLHVSRRLADQPQEDIGRCTGAVRAHGRLAQRGSGLQRALIGEPPRRLKS